MVLPLGVGALGACKPLSKNKGAKDAPGANSPTDLGPLATMPKGYPPLLDNPGPRSICTDFGEDDMPTPERSLSANFLNACSGCHGTSGQGQGTIPALATLTNEQTFKDLVRKGRGLMPAFDDTLISDDDLHHDFALLTMESGAAAVDSRAVLPRRTGPADDESTFATIMLAGLLAWRTPGARGACASCHGPDGIDLARVGYPDSAILRRSMGQGLAPDLALAIVKMIAAARARYRMTTPCVAKHFSPLQPGGRLIAEDSAANDDRALATVLNETASIDLTQAPTDIGEAKALVSKVAELDIQRIPLAIKLNYWTEDAFHGDHHRSTAEWLPEIPLEPQTIPDTEAWVTLQNAYIETPDDRRLWELLDGVKMLSGARFASGGVSERMAREKFKSVLLMQHLLRQGTTNFPDLKVTNDVNRFSIWEAGQIADVMARGCAETGDDNDPFPCWKYPASFFEKMGRERQRLLDDILRVNFPWLVAGWLVDPALQFSENGDAPLAPFHAASSRHLSRFGRHAKEYFEAPFHNLYFGFVRLVKSLEATDTRLPAGEGLSDKAIHACWTIATPGLTQWVEATLPALQRMLAPASGPGPTQEHQDLLHSSLAAANVTILFMVKDSVEHPREVCRRRENRESLKAVVKGINQWNQDTASPNTTITTLASDLENTLTL